MTLVLLLMFSLDFSFSNHNMRMRIVVASLHCCMGSMCKVQKICLKHLKSECSVAVSYMTIICANEEYGMMTGRTTWNLDPGFLILVYFH